MTELCKASRLHVVFNAADAVEHFADAGIFSPREWVRSYPTREQVQQLLGQKAGRLFGLPVTMPEGASDKAYTLSIQSATGDTLTVYDSMLPRDERMPFDVTVSVNPPSRKVTHGDLVFYLDTVASD